MRSRWLLLTALLTLVALACGGGDDDDDGDATATPTATATAQPTATPTPTSTSTPTAAPSEAPARELSISSAAFGEGGSIPVRYSCDGLNVSPPLALDGLPSEAATLALVLDNPDAPGGTFDHWVRYDIPVRSEIAEGASSSLAVGGLGTAGSNDFGNTAYGGPCPPSGTHRYVFTIYALDGELGLAEGATKEQLEAAIEGRVVAQAQLSGTYNRDQAKRPPVGNFPETRVSANLTIGYKVDPSGRPVVFEPAELLAEIASIQAQWYQSGGVYVLVYEGLSIEETGPICPGNSIKTATGFLHLSNSPTAPGACLDTGIREPPVGLRECGEVVAYVTAIPTDVSGNLFGTIARFEPDGSIVGLTSFVPADAGAAPEVDLEALCGG